jgi:hypothetical protein
MLPFAAVNVLGFVKAERTGSLNFPQRAPLYTSIKHAASSTNADHERGRLGGIALKRGCAKLPSLRGVTASATCTGSMFDVAAAISTKDWPREAR